MKAGEKASKNSKRSIEAALPGQQSIKVFMPKTNVQDPGDLKRKRTDAEDASEYATPEAKPLIVKYRLEQISFKMLLFPLLVESMREMQLHIGKDQNKKRRNLEAILMLLSRASIQQLQAWGRLAKVSVALQSRKMC